MKLEKMLRRTGTVLGLMSTLALTGCEDLSDKQAVGLAFGAIAPFSKTLEGKESASFIGNAFISADDADRSRSQVNIYNNTQSQQQVQQQVRNIQPRPLGGTPYSFAFYSMNDQNEDGISVDEMDGAGDNTLFLSKSAKIMTATEVKNFSGYKMDSYLFYIRNKKIKENTPGNFVLINAVKGIVINGNDAMIHSHFDSREIEKTGLKGCFLADFRLRAPDETPEQARAYDTYKFYIYP